MDIQVAHIMRHPIAYTGYFHHTEAKITASSTTPQQVYPPAAGHLKNPTRHTCIGHKTRLSRVLVLLGRGWRQESRARLAVDLAGAPRGAVMMMTGGGRVCGWRGGQPRLELASVDDWQVEDEGADEARARGRLLLAVLELGLVDHARVRQGRPQGTVVHRNWHRIRSRRPRRSGTSTMVLVN